MNASRLELRELKFFVAVAEELHFRRAAERLNVAQPHLSAQLREFEARIGVRLFDRTTRSVTLTPAGSRLLGQARYTLQQVRETGELVDELSQPPRAQLRIGFTPAACHTILPWVLRAFHKAQPEVDISISYMVTSEQVRKLTDGEIDFGFLRTPVRAPHLSTPTLAIEGAVVALPHDHPLTSHDFVRLRDLAKEGFLHFGAVLGYDFEEHIMNCCHRAGFVPRLAAQSSDTHSSITLVAAGFGIALLPEWVASSSHPEVVFKKVPEIPPFISLGAAWRTNRPSPEHLLFREVIAEFSEAHPLGFSRG